MITLNRFGISKGSVIRIVLLILAKVQTVLSATTSFTNTDTASPQGITIFTTSASNAAATTATSSTTSTTTPTPKVRTDPFLDS